MHCWLLYGTCCVLLASHAIAIDELQQNLDRNTIISQGHETSSSRADDQPDVKLPSEVQRAVCTVNAGEVKASAEAVTTKTLKGVCGSDEMKLAFRNLEQKLGEELREIKGLLRKLTDMQDDEDSNSIPIDPPLPVISKSSIGKPATLKMLKFEQITMKPNQPQQLEIAPEREEEVDRFNNTMLTDQDFKLFTYYWKLENITEHIVNAATMSIKSPIFSIRGRTVQLQCTFQHLHREMINLQLTLAYPASKGTGKGTENNIILDMGGQTKHFKWSEHETFKHKIALLDQSQSHRRTQDLSSQELTKLDMGFSIPNSALLGSNYVRHNSLLIQVILYL